MRETIKILLCFLAGLCLGIIIHNGYVSRHADRQTLTETTDTIANRSPQIAAESAEGTRTYTVPAQHVTPVAARTDTVYIIAEAQTEGAGAGGEPRRQERDSVRVELPMIRRHYADSTFSAWVSGPVDPRLDSIKVMERTRTVTGTHAAPPRRWSLGVTAGYGYSPRGPQPFIGVGITYSIISF